jgi:hypothetical protein
VKTTIDLPEDLLRRAKSEAALGGRKFRELVAEALRHRLGIKEAETPAARAPGPLLRSLDDLPFVKARPGTPSLNIPARRIHELEMEAELERHEASLR